MRVVVPMEEPGTASVMEAATQHDNTSEQQSSLMPTSVARIEVTALNKLGKDLMRVIGTICHEEGAEGERFSEGDSVSILFDKRGLFGGEENMTIPELKAALALPRGKDKNASMNAYLRFLTVQYGLEEAERTGKGAVVVHACKVVRISVEPEDGAHSKEPGEKEDKEQRHRVFCEWALETFGKEALCEGSGVIDVAGGRGTLSQIFAENGVPCTCVEPITRDQILSEDYSTISSYFDDNLLASHPALFAESAFLCGMHPDQATELLVKYAVQQEKAFACAPCCVFRGLFPHRRLQNGNPVKTYRGLVRYILEQHPNMRTARLPFDGCNVVLYMKPEDYTAEPLECVACKPAAWTGY